MQIAQVAPRTGTCPSCMLAQLKFLHRPTLFTYRSLLHPTPLQMRISVTVHAQELQVEAHA